MSLSCANGPTSLLRSIHQGKQRKSSGCATPRACLPISAGAPIPNIAAAARSPLSPRRHLWVLIIPVGFSWPSPCSSATRGPESEDAPPEFVRLIDERQLERARYLSAAMRLAYVLSAAMPGLLPVHQAPTTARQGVAPPGSRKACRDLMGERVEKRLAELALTWVSAPASRRSEAGSFRRYSAAFISGTALP